MKEEYEETPFASAAQSFASALPKRIDTTDEDIAKIVVSGWRYDEIAEAVLNMYEKADARVMPLPVFDIANALGYSPIPYRAYGRASMTSLRMRVIPTVTWDKYSSFDFCFDGIEQGSTVAVATYACRLARPGFLRCYDAMLERIKPEAIICYGDPFTGMRGNIHPVPVCHPRQFHRELKRR